jgi:hypothetical protein
MRRFEKNNTVQFVAKFKTFPGKDVDVDSGLPTITITNEVGTNVVDAQSMSSHPNLGMYYALWVPQFEGVYVVMVQGTVQGRVHLARKTFRVVETS